MAAATASCIYVYIHVCVYAIKKNKHFAHAATLMFVMHFMRLYDLAGVETPQGKQQANGLLNILQDCDFRFANL